MRVLRHSPWTSFIHDLTVVNLSSTFGFLLTGPVEIYTPEPMSCLAYQKLPRHTSRQIVKHQLKTNLRLNLVYFPDMILLSVRECDLRKLGVSMLDLIPSPFATHVTILPNTQHTQRMIGERKQNPTDDSRRFRRLNRRGIEMGSHGRILNSHNRYISQEGRDIGRAACDRMRRRLGLEIGTWILPQLAKYNIKRRLQEFDHIALFGNKTCLLLCKTCRGRASCHRAVYPNLPTPKNRRPCRLRADRANRPCRVSFGSCHARSVLPKLYFHEGIRTTIVPLTSQENVCSFRHQLHL